MPPSLAWWASSLQLSGLGPEQAELARQFLSRAAQLDLRIRDQIAYRIAGDVIARISRPRRPAFPRSTCLPPYWLSGTVGSWSGCGRYPRAPPPPQLGTPPQWAPPPPGHRCIRSRSHRPRQPTAAASLPRASRHRPTAKSAAPTRPATHRTAFTPTTARCTPAVPVRHRQVLVT